jgi:hypothetical protein
MDASRDTPASDRAEEQREGGLRRVIGANMLLVFVLGDYALVGEVAGEVGGAVWASFAVALRSPFAPRLRTRSS